MYKKIYRVSGKDWANAREQVEQSKLKSPVPFFCNA